MSSYHMVQQELTRRCAALVQKSASLTELEAVQKVFREDRAFYERYRHASAHQPMPDVRTRPPITPTGVDAEVEQLVSGLVAKGMSVADATAQVFRGDPALYQKYRQESLGGLPTGPVEPTRQPAAATPSVPDRLTTQAFALAQMLSPQDEVAGLAKVATCLEGLIEALQRRRAR
jgi:hypothetical protein